MSSQSAEANSLALNEGASSDPPHGFAALLRERTATIHREAERSGFIADLIRARATRNGYALFLRNLVPIYAALETALEARRGTLFRPFADPSLRRLDALVADLRVIAGEDWAATRHLLPEAEAYARAIAATSGDDRLVAHAYARYLGDLSGGQILKPVLARTLGLSPDALTFYDFPAIPDLAAAKAAMREALDSVDPSDGEGIIGEAIAAFRHNIVVSGAVQAAAGT